jgi:hypothetical protein
MQKELEEMLDLQGVKTLLPADHDEEDIYLLPWSRLKLQEGGHYWAVQGGSNVGALRVAHDDQQS